MKKLPVALLALLTFPAGAQEPVSYVVPPTRTITVAGEATVEVAPDRALVQFGVETSGPVPARVFSEHEQDVERVLTAVRGFGIADRQIELQALSLSPGYGDRRDTYTATRLVQVTVDDLRQVPELVAAVVGEGANRLVGLTYTLQDADRVEDQALEEAVARAREKAERLASASGAQLGRVIRIAEQGVQPPGPMPVMAYARMDVESTPGAYSAGTSEVRAAVVVTFEVVD